MTRRTATQDISTKKKENMNKTECLHEFVI